ncbi:hypothetical protein ACSBR1_017004 [Camellia fascicularis]
MALLQINSSSFKLDCISVSDQRRPLLFDEPRTPSNPYNYLDINESEYEYQVILGIPSKEFRQILRYIREFATLVVNVIVTDAEVLPFRSGSEDLILTKDLRKSSKFSLSSTLYCIAAGCIVWGVDSSNQLDILVTSSITLRRDMTLEFISVKHMTTHLPCSKIGTQFDGFGRVLKNQRMGLSSHQQSLFHGLIESARKQLPKLVVGSLLIGAGIAFYTNRVERINQLFLQPDIITAGIDEVSSNTKPLIRQIRKLPKRVKKLMEMIPHQEVNEEEASLFDMSWLLFASVIYVPIFQKIPGGSPVLGYLTAVILIGPYGLSIIHHVHGIKAIAEFEVVFLMFNIGLELSVERLSSMKKYVFGLGSAQVLVTAVVVGLVSCFIAGQPSPAAIIVGNGLALSSTVVVLQVGFQAIAEPLGLAVAKAIVAITAIIAGGRLPLRPIYKQVAENQNAEIFSANTLLVILGTGLLTARVESDIAPYRGLLLGLFFMMVGMSIDPKLFVSNFLVIMGTLPLLIGGKTILVAVAGRLFGISIISAIRVGLLLAPGGEFAFVAFGEAVNQKKNYLRGFGIGPQRSSTFDAAARARDQQMDAMRAEIEALHEERATRS